MDATEILSLLEQPTRNRWRFIYQIRDEAAVTDVIAALRASTRPHICTMLCYVLNLRAGAESFAGQERETRQAVPALIELLADPDHNVRDGASDALGHICDTAAGPALLAAYHQEPDDFGLRVSLAAT